MIANSENRFDAWLRSVDSYTGNDLLYLNSAGTIPGEAIITKGEKRANSFKERREFDRTNFAASDDTKIAIDVEEAVDEDAEDAVVEGKLEETEG